MFLLCCGIASLTYWYTADKHTTLWTGASLLLLACLYYVRYYPYPPFEKPGFFTWFFMVLFAAAGTGILWMAPRSSAPTATLVFGAVFWVALIAITLAQSPHRAALTRPYEDVRSEVIQAFFEVRYPDLQASFGQGLFSVPTIRDWALIRGNFHEIEYGLALEGRAGGCPFACQAVKLIEVSKDSKGKTSRSTVFEGVVARMQQGRVQQTPVLIRPHRPMEVRDIFLEETRRIEMEDPAFEAHCDVVSADEWEARRLLTPSFMLRLPAFMTGPVRIQGIHFGPAATFVAVHTQHALLEADFANPEHAKKRLEESQRTLDRLLEILQEVLR